MKYNYQARTKTGEVQTGIVEASSKEAAISVLQRYGLYVTILESAEEVPLFARKIKVFEKVSQEELVLFSRQLSIMFGSKIPLFEALRTLAGQTPNATFRDKILKIADDVEGGTSFSSALSKYPETFSSFYVAMVKSGEASGKLSEVLDYLAEHLEREYHLMSRLKGALMYPAIVVILAILILALMIFFVVPQMSEVLAESGQELPTITRIMMDVSNFLRTWGLLMIAILVILIIMVLRFSKTKAGKEFFDEFSLKIPILGNFLKLTYLSRFAENLSTLISGGLSISQCLEISAKIVGNSIYEKIIMQARDEVRRGEQISQVLYRFPQFFTPIFIQMSLVGERTGTLDKTLMNLVSFYQKEIERTADNMLSVLEPILIAFLGVVVGGIMAAFLIPIYQTAGL